MNSSDALELTKEDTKMAQGVAILGMVTLHLFCRLGPLPYTPLIWIGDKPLIYYLGLFGDYCVPIYCFCSGYAHYLLFCKQGKDYKKRIPHKILKFLSNYWIVVILFSLIGLAYGKSSNIPRSWEDFARNMLVVGMNYNGAWWFVVTYLILLILSPFTVIAIKRTHPLIICSISIIYYVVAYYFRFNYSVNFNHRIINWIFWQLILLGTSQLTYILGMIFYKNHILTKLRLLKIKFFPQDNINIILILIVCILITIHGIFQTVFIAPFTAGGLLICLFLSNLNIFSKSVLLFLGRHSTNIWLVHMFFYLVLFEGLVYKAKYPVMILFFMIFVCTFFSFTIYQLQKILNKCFLRRNKG